MFLSKNKKNLTFLHLKTTIFTAVKYCSILHGHVCVMSVICQAYIVIVELMYMYNPLSIYYLFELVSCALTKCIILERELLEWFQTHRLPDLLRVPASVFGIPFQIPKEDRNASMFTNKVNLHQCLVVSSALPPFIARCFNCVLLWLVHRYISILRKYMVFDIVCFIYMDKNYK